MTALTKLSRREREILEIIFELEEATLSEILARVEKPPTRPALRSILTILLEKGKLTQSNKRGREFLYRATESRKRAGQSAIGRVLDTFFSGSLTQAMSTHLSDPKAQYSEEELAQLAKLIEAKRTQNSNDATK